MYEPGLWWFWDIFTISNHHRNSVEDYKHKIINMFITYINNTKTILLYNTWSFVGNYFNTFYLSPHTPHTSFLQMHLLVVAIIACLRHFARAVVTLDVFVAITFMGHSNPLRSVEVFDWWWMQRRNDKGVMVNGWVVLWPRTNTCTM